MILKRQMRQNEEIILKSSHLYVEVTHRLMSQFRDQSNVASKFCDSVSNYLDVVVFMCSYS